MIVCVDHEERVQRLRRLADEFEVIDARRVELDEAIKDEIAGALRDGMPQQDIVSASGRDRQAVRRIRIAQDIPPYPLGGFRK